MNIHKRYKGYQDTLSPVMRPMTCAVKRRIAKSTLIKWHQAAVGVKIRIEVVYVWVNSEQQDHTSHRSFSAIDHPSTRL